MIHYQEILRVTLWWHKVGRAPRLSASYSFTLASPHWVRNLTLMEANFILTKMIELSHISELRMTHCHSLPGHREESLFYCLILSSLQFGTSCPKLQWWWTKISVGKSRTCYVVVYKKEMIVNKQSTGAFEGSDTILCDIVSVDMWHYVFGKIHRPVQHKE